MDKIRALFLTNENALRSAITGGVQLCSQEFHQILENIEQLTITDYYIPYTRNILQRVKIRSGFEDYSTFDVKKHQPALIRFIRENGIGLVFINMASAVRFAKPVREAFGDKVKIVLLSHGNHSGDLLHLITKPVKTIPAWHKLKSRIRIGLLISTEAEYRVKYLDGVVALSETEKQIENWLGAKKVVFQPRRLYADFLDHHPVPGRVGFVGRLDHPPNWQGLTILLDEVKKSDHHQINIRVVGAPESAGRELAALYPFIEYLGELSDEHLEKEISGWSILLNPVWWYSTGASTKLGRAISWGVPIVTSTEGMRGYEWKEGSLIVADTPEKMANAITTIALDSVQVNHWAAETKKIAVNGPSMELLISRIRSTYT